MALSLNEFKPFIDWMQANPGLSALAVFFISCAESLAIVGLFIPGTVIMPAIGSMIGTGVLPAPWIILAAILGAIIGDNLSYWLGFHFHQRIRLLWPFNHFPQLLVKGENFFRRYGGLSVFIGRFVGPVRPIIPVVAGMMNMPPLRFFASNISSAIAWAIIYMAPGILLGAISEQLAPHVAAKLLIILAIITFCVWLLMWIANKIWNHSYRMIERISHRWWLYLTCHFRLARYFIHLEKETNPKPLSIALYLLFFAGLLLLTTFSVWHNGLITFLNWPVFFFFRSIQILPLDTFMAYLFNLTSPMTLLSIIFSVFAWLLLVKARRAAFFWLFNLGLTTLFAWVLQNTLKISPPDPHTIFYSAYAYPSLSFSVFIAITGNFIILSYYNTAWLRYKKYLLLGMGALIAIASVPLLYLGFNWLSDCIASFCCGALSTWICILFYHRATQRVALRPPLFIASIALIISTITSSITDTPTLLDNLAKPQFSLNYPLEAWWVKNTLPIALTRNNFLGTETELMSIQYAGQLEAITKTLQKAGWEIAPKPSFIVIVNRIAAKDRSQVLPLFPDLYENEKPILIMTKQLSASNQMLILRLWPSQVSLQPKNLPLWVGTIKFHRIWHWNNNQETLAENETSPLLILQKDLPKFSSAVSEASQPLCKENICQKEFLKLMYTRKVLVNDDEQEAVMPA